MAHAERLATLSRVTRLVASAQGSEHVFDAVAEAAATLLGASAARVWVVDRAAGILRSHGDFAFDPGVKALTSQATEIALGEGLVGRIIESTRPEYVLDVAADPRWVHPQLVTAAGLRGFAGVPLVTGDHVVGALAILFRGERHFSPEEQELTRLLADQAAIAIRNTRLFEETERRRREAESLAALGRAVSQTLEPRDVARRIADSVRTLLGTLSSALYVLDARSGALTSLAVSGDAGNATAWITEWPKGTGAAGLVVRERRPVSTVNLLTDERITLTAHQRALIELAPHRAALAVPLLVQGAVIGALGVGDYPGRRFDADDIRLLEAFADQASSALENARLYELAERDRRRLQVLNDVSRRLAASHETDQILSLIIDEAARLVGADAGGLRLLSDGELVLRACTDSARAIMSRPRMKLGEGLTGLVVASGDVFAVEDLEAYERYAPDLRHAAVTHGLRAGLAVPLRALGEIVGALVLFCKERRRFTDDEIGLLTAFADQSALAIVKDRLLRQAEDRARRLRTLAHLNQVVSSSLDLNEVLAAIARAAAEIMQARHASFWVVDPSGQRLTVGAVSDETWWSDYPSPAITLERGGVTAAVARDQQEIGIPDVCGDPRIITPQWYRAHGLTSYYGIPIILDGSTVAVLNLAGAAPFSFDADGRDVLESFVAQAAAALRNARLYEERRLANEQLERSQSQLVQTERLRALGEMAAGVAHHFNNLLAIVSGRTQLLLRRAEDGELRRALGIIEQAVADGAQRVRRIQEFTRTRPASPGGHVELSRLLQDVVDFTSSRWKDEAQSRGVHYSVRVEGDAVAVAGAPDELREVFINLLLNALEAMPSGGECTFGVHVDEDCAIVGVRDTGAGMSDETRTRAFEPFFSTKGPQGNGLGLAVVWGVVTRYGGTVQIESAPGLGCTFTIRLPLSREAARSTDAPRPASAVRAARILVVDDEHEVGTILADVLSTIGYSAVHVTTGREGLALCESERFDAILSDLSMPEMSGWQVAAACRERYPGVPVGLVTGWGNQLDPGQLAEHRIRFVLPKPFDVAEVARQVGDALKEGATAGSPGS